MPRTVFDGDLPRNRFYNEGARSRAWCRVEGESAGDKREEEEACRSRGGGGSGSGRRFRVGLGSPQKPIMFVGGRNKRSVAAVGLIEIDQAGQRAVSRRENE